MAEDSGKAVSTALGVIPNAYFDLIGRVMPGGLFLFAISQVSSTNAVLLLMNLFTPYGELHGSTTAWLVVIISASYILGHSFSPMVRFLEEGPPWVETLRDNIRTKQEKEKKIDNGQKQRSVWDRVRYCYLPPFWSCPDAGREGREKLHQEYNQLRLQSPGVTAMAIRIRAEYTMYGGFAIAIAIALLVALINAIKSLALGKLRSDLQPVSFNSWLLLGIGIVAVPIMLYRHLHTWKRYRKTVGHFLNPSLAPAEPKSQAAAAG